MIFWIKLYLEYRLLDKKISLKLTEQARNFIVDSAYDEVYGARPIKRFVSRNLETLLASAIIEDKIKYDSLVTIDVENNQFVLQ